MVTEPHWLPVRPARDVSCWGMSNAAVPIKPCRNDKGEHG